MAVKKPKPKRKHVFRYAWDRTFRKCHVCNKTWWWWHCDDKWSRTTPPETIEIAPALKLGKRIYLDKETRKEFDTHEWGFKVWDKVSSAYRYVTYREYIQETREENGHAAHAFEI